MVVVSAKIIDLKKRNGVFFHFVEITEGVLRSNDEVEIYFNKEHRNAVMRNHTATHLLHYALRKVLGNHVSQKGSMVSNKLLRFDFSHLSAMSKDELKVVEDIVNNEILSNHKVFIKEMEKDEAIKDWCNGFI